MMANYMGQRIIDMAYTYDYVISKRPDLKEGINAYLIEQGRADLITLTIPTAPFLNIDDTLNKVVGMNTSMEYNLDSTGYVKYVDTIFNAIDFSGAHTLLVRISAVVGISAVSPDTTLTFTAN